MYDMAWTGSVASENTEGVREYCRACERTRGVTDRKDSVRGSTSEGGVQAGVYRYI